jgi:hypothetical protein
MDMYELGFVGSFVNICCGLMAVWMAHRLYRSTRKTWQIVATWALFFVLSILCAYPLRRVVPWLSAGRLSEVVWLTAILAYVYLFGDVPLAQRIYTYFLLETSMALVVLLSRVLSVYLAGFVSWPERWMFLGFFLIFWAIWTIAFEKRLRFIMVETLSSFGKNLTVITAFAAVGYGMLLILADPWGTWNRLSGYAVLAWVGIILFVLFAYAMAFKALLSLNDQSTAEKDAQCLEEQLALSEEYYRGLVQQVELARSYNHDMHYHVETLNGLSAAGDMAGMQEYVAEMGKDLPGSLPKQYCAVGAVNALLERYADQCRERGIDLRCQLELSPQTKIHPIHLCVIFGNGLQNALEAVEKLPEEALRWIEVQAKQEGERLAIRITNPCPQRPDLRGGRPATTKTEPGHGMGLENIQAAAGRYSGWSGASWENGVFALSVVLRDKDN